jgi:uncharacterized membrane protein YphA (DoxX/SURF4 family)
MNTIVWILQSLLAVMFVFSGILILVQPKEKLATKMPFVNDLSPAMVKLVAFAHMFGAIGLILPELLNIYTILTPIAAACLALVMLLAINYNYKRHDIKSVLVDLVICILFIIIAIFRFKY